MEAPDREKDYGMECVCVWIRDAICVCVREKYMRCGMEERRVRILLCLLRSV